MEKYQFSKNKKIKSIKNMGIDTDKNEYMEIVLSNSAHPERLYENNFKTNKKNDFFY